jgi:hypothetical protein
MARLAAATRVSPVLLVAAAIAGGAAVARADLAVPPRPRHQSPGLALQAEVGRYDGGEGLAAAYYLPVPCSLLTAGVEAGAGLTGSDRQGKAGRLHLFVAHGQVHRVLASGGWTVVDRDTLDLHGSPALDRSVWGPELTLGYELLAAHGPLVRIWLSASYARTPQRVAGDRWRPGLGLAAGWKLW